MLEIFADGSSLGNPGNAGVGIVIYKNKKIFKKLSFYIGKVTNNFAEYAALISALQEAAVLGGRPVYVYMDSQLVTRQVEGSYKVKDSNLYPLNILVKNLLNIIGDCRVCYKPRQDNKLADSLAKKAAKSGSIAKTAKSDKIKDFQLKFET